MSWSTVTKGSGRWSTHAAVGGLIPHQACQIIPFWIQHHKRKTRATCSREYTNITEHLRAHGWRSREKASLRVLRKMAYKTDAQIWSCSLIGKALACHARESGIVTRQLRQMSARRRGTWEPSGFWDSRKFISHKHKK